MSAERAEGRPVYEQYAVVVTELKGLSRFTGIILDRQTVDALRQDYVELNKRTADQGKVVHFVPLEFIPRAIFGRSEFNEDVKFLLRSPREVAADPKPE